MPVGCESAAPSGPTLYGCRPWKIASLVNCDACRIVSVDGGLPLVEDGAEDAGFGAGHARAPSISRGMPKIS
jgi:hypothetical protein